MIRDVGECILHGARELLRGDLRAAPECSAFWDLARVTKSSRISSSATSKSFHLLIDYEHSVSACTDFVVACIELLGDRSQFR